MEADEVGSAGGSCLLQITSAAADSAVVVTAAGEVDLETGPRLRAGLSEWIERPDAVPVIVDLTGVTFLSSTGIAVLVDANWQAEQSKVALRIVVTADQMVHRTLASAGVDHYLALYHDLGSALAAGNSH